LVCFIYIYYVHISVKKNNVAFPTIIYNIINIFSCRFNSSLYYNYWENNYKLKLKLHSAHSSPPVFSGVCVPRSLVLCVCFVYRYFVLLAFFFWPLCCLFFNLRILITPLVSSKSSK